MPFWAYFLSVPVFGLLILVHELGHYLAARLNGIAVAEFAIGFGPRLFGFTWRETEWNLRLIPLGGYVRWHEDGWEAFHNASLRARFWALVAGPLANMLLTYLLMAGLFGAMLPNWWQGAGLALKETAMATAAWWKVVFGAFLGQGIDLVGPTGIASITAERAMLGPGELVFFVAYLSLNLGLFNLLPFPALDGGRICFLGLERIRRRPLDPFVEGWIHAGGFVLMIALAVLTTVKDLLA